MSARTVEIFSAGCHVCREAIEQVEDAACPSCDVRVRDTTTGEGRARARELGLEAVPAVAIDGELVRCCEGGGPDLEVLEAAGLGRPA